MGLASLVPPKHVDLPGGEWVTIRKLGYRKLRKIREAAQAAGIAQAKAMGGEMMAALRNIGNDDVREARELQRSPLFGYDIDALLEASIVSWSIDERVTPEAIAELDEDVAEAIALASVEFSARQRTEDDTKNS